MKEESSINNQYNQKLVFWKTNRMDKSLKSDVGKNYFQKWGIGEREAYRQTKSNIKTISNILLTNLKTQMKWLSPEETKLLKPMQEQL